MNNNELNVFEILKQTDSQTEKRKTGNKNEERDSESEFWKKSGQEQNAPDPFFQEALQQAIAPQAEEPQKRKIKGTLVKALKKWKKAWIGEVAIIVAVFLFFAIFVVNISQVSGSSMTPNFYPGDRVLILRPGKWNIERGDVIVFKTEDGEKLMKRVVAQEGDTVDISSTKGGLYVNGKEVKEEGIYTTTSVTDREVTYPVTVEENCCFVLGDNRTESKDSRNREIGQIEKKDIIGKVIFNFRGV